MAYSGTLTAPDSTRWATPTAIPDETPTPSKACSRVRRRRRRSVFIELAPDKIEYGRERLFRIAPVHRHLDLVADSRREHHQSHDRAPVGGQLAPADLDVGFEFVGQVDEFGGRARMQTALVPDEGHPGQRAHRLHAQPPASASRWEATLMYLRPASCAWITATG